MKEINEKDLEKASGGADQPEEYVRHEKTYSCPFFNNPALSELKKNFGIAELDLNCYVCANAKAVGDGTEDVYCVIGYK